MQTRSFLAAFASGAFAAATAIFACGGGGSGTSPDAGPPGRHDAGVDLGITVFPPTKADAFIKLPETSVPDVGHIEAAPPPDTGSTDAGGNRVVADVHRPDGGVDGGVDGSVDAPVADAPDAGCTMVTVPSTTAGAVACHAPVSGMCAGDTDAGPSSLGSFVPTAPLPTGLWQNKCTAAQIQSIYDDCIIGSTCPEMGNSSVTCFNCIFTNSGAAKWGPVIETPTSVNVNLGGCISLLEPCNVACGNAFEYTYQCNAAACGASCPIGADAASFTAFNNCGTEANGCAADGGGCYLWANGQLCANQLDPAGRAATQCFPSTNTFEAAYLSVAAVFCGPPP